MHTNMDTNIPARKTVATCLCELHEEHSSNEQRNHDHGDQDAMIASKCSHTHSRVLHTYTLYIYLYTKQTQSACAIFHFQTPSNVRFNSGLQIFPFIKETKYPNLYLTKLKYPTQYQLRIFQFNLFINNSFAFSEFIYIYIYIYGHHIIFHLLVIGRSEPI